MDCFELVQFLYFYSFSFVSLENCTYRITNSVNTNSMVNATFGSRNKSRQPIFVITNLGLT